MRTERTSEQQVEKVEEAIQNYEGKKAGAKTKAEDFEAISKASSIKGGTMALAVSFFSVAIAMTSMCLVTKKKPLWILAIVLAAFSVLEMVRAWTS